MSQEANAKVIGAFVLGAVLLAVAVVLYFGSGDFRKDKELYVIYFAGDVNGLKVGSGVMVRGVTIGTVESVTAIMDAQGEVYIEVIIENISGTVRPIGGLAEELTQMAQAAASKDLIHMGLRARLESQSMVTGQKYIKLDFFPETTPKLVGLNQDYPEIPSIPSAGEVLQRQLHDSIDGLKAAVERIGELKLPELSASLRQLVESANTFVSSNDASQALRSMNSTLNSADTLMSKLTEEVSLVRVALERNSGQLDTALVSAQKLLEETAEIPERDRYAMQVAFKEMSQAARSMRLLTDHLQREPRSVIFGKKE